jgi:hypothetical protein
MEYGFDKICLTVNKRNAGAVAAYHKMGFETVDSVNTDIGGGFFMDDYVMELSVRDTEGQTKIQLDFPLEIGYNKIISNNSRRRPCKWHTSRVILNRLSLRWRSPTPP